LEAKGDSRRARGPDGCRAGSGNFNANAAEVTQKPQKNFEIFFRGFCETFAAFAFRLLN